MNKEEILNLLRTTAEEAGTLLELSTKTGIPRTYLYSIFKGNPTLESLLKLCEALNLKLEVRK